MRIVIAAAVLFGLAACASPPVNRDASRPLTTVASVDVDGYLGRWYEIARFENSFEENCEGVTADYSRRDDGLISVVNTCREGSPSGKARTAAGRAKIADGTTNARLKVSFFGPFWGDYWILDLTDDYSRAIVGEPSGRYLWVLARTPTLDDAARAAVMTRLEEFGYNTGALYFSKQPPEPDNPRPE
jgi:apolipoprotein D and lipocalin family protein